MRPILIDTNAYSAFKRGDKNVLELLQHVEEIGMSPIVLGELLSGFDRGNKSKQNRKELNHFLGSSRVKIYPITIDTSNFYSSIYYDLKRKGNPIPTNDMWIAAQALENGCVMCTYDKHFEAIDGLMIGKTILDVIF